MINDLSLVAEAIHITYRTYLDPQVDLRARLRKGRKSSRRRHTDIHAVRGLSFDLHKGESIGIIGHNGAGKSTVLLGLAGLIELTQGRVLSVARPTLLGVGSVLNMNLSGRRNIELGCLALGMSRDAITARMDDLIDFSGLTEFVDLPLKAYSSGMKARLSFTVATVGQPEILLIDEALAVGDADFREKATERLEQIRAGAGSVVLVSHNVAEVSRMCDRVIWLDRGKVVRDGSVQRVLSLYAATRSNPDLLSDLVSKEPAGIGSLVSTPLQALLRTETDQIAASTMSARQSTENHTPEYVTPFAVDIDDAHEVQAVGLAKMLAPNQFQITPVQGAVLRDWLVHHPSGALIIESDSSSNSGNGTVLTETSSPWFPKWYPGWDRNSDGNLTLNDEPPRVDTQAELIYCATTYPNSFTHWWIDVAARVHIALRSPELNGLKFILPASSTTFQRDALLALGLDSAQIYTPGQTVERISAIHHPGATQHGGRDRVQLDTAVIAAAVAVRERVIPDGPKAHGRRIYVSRDHDDSRNVRNSDEVDQALLQLGFEIIHPDELSFAATVEIFAGAETVVGVTGDGMANVVFCDPGTTIVTILPDTFTQAHIWAIATMAHHEFAILAGRAFGSGSENQEQSVYDDLEIPVHRLLAILSQAGLASPSH